jgi:hypothetical protein
MTLRKRSILTAAISALFAPAAIEQVTNDPNGPSGPQEIDACGTLVQMGPCVVFEGGGGSYVLADYGRFRIGDAVRVIGTADPDCITICPDADGCIRGAVLYDPAIWPCGTPIPSVGEDLLPAITESACSALGSAATMLTIVGLIATRVRRRRPLS